MEKLNQKQVTALRCAHADLLGALQARNQLDMEVHDWKSHLLTLTELEEAFPEILKDVSVTCDRRV